MAFKCIRSTFAKRIYEQGSVYDSIGFADEKFFEEVEVQVDDAQVIETGLADEGESGSSDERSVLDKAKDLFRGKKGDPQIAELKAALKELEVEFAEDADLETLQGLLLEAQSNALTS